MEKTFVLEFVQDAGLGNQMFEWAAGYNVARQLDMPYRWVWKKSKKRNYMLDVFGIRQRRPEGRYTVVMEKVGQGNKHQFREACRRVEASPDAFPAVSCPFQEFACFEEVADEVRDLYSLPPLQFDVPRGKTPVAVQVRKTDYAEHPRLDVVTPTYFRRGMLKMREMVENPHFFFTSDDLEWCRRMFRDDPDVTVLPDHSAVEGLRMMLACKGHIISNSTFGWWGAWLAPGPTVCPERWHHVPGSYGEWNPPLSDWVRVGGIKEDRLVPQLAIREFRKEERWEPTEYAIVYPWKHDAARWEELRYSLRSIHRFFEDRSCPIYILGTKRPNWLLHGANQRVRYEDAYCYWEALTRGVQIASKVLWMNDDILLLRSTTWADCSIPYHVGDIPWEKVEKAEFQSNPWRAGAIRALKMLYARGIGNHHMYSTHLPYVFEREKAARVLDEFGVWDKMPTELLYFHLYPDGTKKLPKKLQAHAPPFGGAQFLNYFNQHLTGGLKSAIKALLPDFAPWELRAPFKS